MVCSLYQAFEMPATDASQLQQQVEVAITKNCSTSNMHRMTALIAAHAMENRYLKSMTARETIKLPIHFKNVNLQTQYYRGETAQRYAQQLPA